MKINVFIFLFLFLVCILSAYLIMYKMVAEDAKKKGLKHPKLISFLVTGGNNGNALPLYRMLTGSFLKEDRSRFVKYIVGAVVSLFGALVFAVIFILQVI